jgi:hypothetical protein
MSIVKLPTSAPTFYTVKKQGKLWAVMLVTPIEGCPHIETAVFASPSRSDAVSHGKAAASAALRPFKGRCA